MAARIAPYLVYLVVAYFLVGSVHSGALWSLGRRLATLDSEEWTRFGAPDVRAFRLQQGPRYEWGQFRARLRLGLWAFTSAPRRLGDRKLDLLVALFRVSTVLTYGGALALLWLFLQ